MFIVDAHLDLAWNALQWNRDLRQSVYTLRVEESHLTGPGRRKNTVALPELRKANVAICFGTLLARSTGHPQQDIDYASPQQAYAIAQGQLAYYHALADSKEIALIKDKNDLDSHIAGWQSYESDPQLEQPPVGIIISMESADPILEPEQLSAWQEAGVRIIGPAHYGLGRYAGGTSTESGLTDKGIKLLQEMEKLGMLLDLTHLSDKAFWESLNLFNGIVLASHNNCRMLVSHQRQFDDDQIRAIIQRNGVIGAALDNWMIRPGWVRGRDDNPRVVLNDVVDHIDHICQLAGNCHHIAIGSDLDGGFGLEQSPADLDTIVDLQKFPELLTKRGYNTNDIHAIMHGNWLGLLRRAWS